MRSVLAKLSAICLIVLAISPFTAPFSTCDLGALSDNGAGEHGFATKTVKASDDSLVLPQGGLSSGTSLLLADIRRRPPADARAINQPLVRVLRL